MTTVCPVDAFERAVSEARDRLSQREGSVVSWRELVRRAGFDDTEFGRVSYHMLPRERTRNGHHVPTWLIDALAPVLPISRGELMQAAAEAAGYDVTEGGGTAADPDSVITQVTRLLDDENIDPAERERIGLEVMQAITRAMQTRRRTSE